MAEDASIFDYDSHFESIQQQRTVPKQQEKLARKSRYIEGLLDKAKEREREQDIVYERRCATPWHSFEQEDAAWTQASWPMAGSTAIIRLVMEVLHKLPQASVAKDTWGCCTPEEL